MPHPFTCGASRKAAAATIHVLFECETASELQLRALLFLADHDHFLHYGRTITGDRWRKAEDGVAGTVVAGLMEGRDPRFERIGAGRIALSEEIDVVAAARAVGRDLDDDERGMLALWLESTRARPDRILVDMVRGARAWRRSPGEEIDFLQALDPAMEDYASRLGAARLALGRGGR